jgi:hypothetical protein
VAVVQRGPLERLRSGGHARPDPSSATRRFLAVAAALLCLAFAAGCGDEEQSSANLPGALGYMPADAYVVALAPTDFDGQQLTRLEHLLGPALRESGAKSLRNVLIEPVPNSDPERDIAPLLGDTLVLAASGSTDHPQVLAALDTHDTAKAKALVEKVPDSHLRVDGTTLLIPLEGREGLLDAAIERHKAGKGMTADAFAGAYGDGADDDALVRVLANGHTLASLLDVDVDVPWIKALRSVAVSLRLDEDQIDARLRVSTDPDGLSEDDLPLATGDDAPQAGDIEGAVNSANRDQSRTTVFLARLARTAYPDSDFVHEVEKLESETGIKFEDAVLKEFNGPSASVAWPDGTFGAVSDVADPDAMRALLPKLAPRLPAILRGLRGLGNSGLVALLLMAPDAPLVPGALPLLDGIEVGRTNHGLYEITGLDEESSGPEFAVPAVVFGMVGDRFVVATDESRAHQVATMKVSDVEDAHGAAVARADLGTLPRRTIAEDTFPIKTVKLGQATGELQAALDGIQGRLRIEVPGGLD